MQDRAGGSERTTSRLPIPPWTFNSNGASARGESILETTKSALGEWKTIASLKGDDDREKYLMGVAYNNIIDGNLAVAAGYKSAADFITTMLKQAAEQPPDSDGIKVRELTPGMLATYGSVARSYSIDDFSLYGHTSLNLLQRYCKAAGIDPKTPPSDIRVKIGMDGETPIEKPFAECTVRDMRAALKLLRPAPQELSEADQEQVELLNLAVDTVVGTEIRSDLIARIRDGQLFFTLQDVPRERFEEVLWALLDAMQDR